MSLETAYRYRAISRSGTPLSGIENARTLEHALAQLQARNIITLEIGLLRKPNLLARAGIAPSRKVPHRALLDVTSEIAILVGANLTIDRAIELVTERVNNAQLRHVLSDVREAVRRGESLADGMAVHSDTFGPLYIAMVRSGEASGQLGSALERLNSYLQDRDKVTHQLRTALVYPCVLMAAGIASLFVMSEFVIPQFIPLFKDSGKSLPVPTRIVIFISDALTTALPLVIFFGAAAILIGPKLLQRVMIRHWVDGMLLRLPVVGLCWRNLDTARFSRAAGFLLRGGETVPVSFEIANGAMSNSVMRQSGIRALKRVREGSSIAEAVAEGKYFPAVSTQLLVLAEETGQLENMLLKQADLLENASERLISSILALLVPTLTLCIGAFVGLVMAAVMLAVLKLNDIAG